MANATPQLGMKEELAQAIKEMDSRTGSLSEAEVFDKLRGVLGNKQVSPEEFAVYLGRKQCFFLFAQAKGRCSVSWLLPTAGVVYRS